MTEIQNLTLEETRAAAQELLNGTTGDLTGADAERFEALRTRAEQIRAEQTQRTTATRDLVQRLASGELRTEAGCIQDRGVPDQDRTPALQQRDAGMRQLDTAVKAGRLAAGGAEVVERLMDGGPLLSQSWARRYAAAAGAPEYERAFAKLLGNPLQGHLTWTPQEADAFRVVSDLQTEQRAMGSGDTSGGYMVPLTLDPAIQLTSTGSTNPLRQLARVVQITTDSWNGVTSAGVTAEWITEGSEVADASPTLDQPSIPVYKADAFVPFSFEIQGDAAGFMTELAKLLQDGADQLTATAYTTGSGTGQPTGIITALTGGSSVVTGDGSEALAASDPYKVQNALPPRFQPRATWNANLATLNTLRQFETTNGALKFPELTQNPPMLLRRSIYENSNMDGAINTAATEANYLLLYGDFSQFVIVDRIGSTLELVPHLFGANRRPTGQRGALLWFRTGSDAVVDNAFRLLNVPTTA